MADLRLLVFALLTVVVVSGTTYSVLHGTYLDTSNPLLTHLPHPLSNTHYFANKSNPLNVYFIKKAWAWTSAAFFLSWLTSTHDSKTISRFGKWLVETAMWLAFTAWFFGPALIERVILASGGECVLALPSGEAISIPSKYCTTRSHLSPTSHPDLFSTLSLAPPSDWNALPRLRRGHDISGHIFLLVMATLFLTDQLRYSLRLPYRSTAHTFALVANVVLIATWLFATFTTCLYFHSPFEKLTGFVLGVGCFVITLLPEVEEHERIKKAERTNLKKQI